MALKRLARSLWRRVAPSPARRVARLAFMAHVERVERRRQPRPRTDLDWHPVVRLVIPVRDQSPQAVRASVASVRAQRYPAWQAYVIPDGPARLTARVERRIGASDPRIVVWREPASARPNAAVNAAIAVPGADYVAVIEPGDTLEYDALQRVVEWLNGSPGADVIYTDECIRGSVRRARAPETVRKPDWSPDHARSEPYVGRLCAFRRALAADAGGLDEGFDTAREYDLLLRLSERDASVGHVPHAVYRRAAPPSVRATEARSLEVERAVAGHLRRIGADADVDAPTDGVPHRVRYRVRGSPRVSIVIPTVGTTTREVAGRPVDLLANTVRSIVERTEYRNFEIVYVHDRALRAETLAVLAEADVPVRAVRYDRAFNWSDKMNLGASVAVGDHILALNDDVEVIDGGWMSALLEYSQQEPIGAVGGKLLFPDHSIQHVGVVIQAGAPGHPYYGCPPARQAGLADLQGVRNYSAVTGACLMTRATVLREVGGFAPEFPLNYNDIDYCLRVSARGYRVVFTPYARLFHLESVSRTHSGTAGVQAAELARLARAWPDVCARDPYHDPRRRSVWLW